MKDRLDPLIDSCLDQICKHYNIGVIFSIPVSSTQSFEDTAFAGECSLHVNLGCRTNSLFTGSFPKALSICGF